MQNIENVNHRYNFEISKKIIDSETRVIRDSITKNIVGSLSKPYRNILHFFYCYPNEVISKTKIKSVGWEGKIVSESSVLVAISEIRILVGKNRILTISGEGYMLLEDD